MTKQGYLILGVVIILLVAGALFAWQKREGTVTPPVIEPAPVTQKPTLPTTAPPTAPTPQTPQTPAGWKTYRNEKLGFEISYPGEWHYRKINEKEIFIEEEAYSEGSGFGVEIKIVDKLSDDVYKEIIEKYGTQVISKHIINFANKNIRELNIHSAMGDDYAILIFPENSKTFMISRGLGKYVLVHKQILSTFRFLK